VNPGDGSGWDEPPLDVQIPDDARELERDRAELVDRFAFAAKICKRDPFGCPVATDANRSRQKSIACDLAGNATAIELQNEFVLCYLAQVVGVWFAFIDHP